MQDPDDKDTLVINDIHNQMFFVLVNAHRRVKFPPFRRYLRGLCQSSEFFIQPAQITPPLDRAPLILRIAADFPDIALRCVADTKTLPLRRVQFPLNFIHIEVFCDTAV